MTPSDSLISTGIALIGFLAVASRARPTCRGPTKEAARALIEGRRAGEKQRVGVAAEKPGNVSGGQSLRSPAQTIPAPAT